MRLKRIAGLRPATVLGGSPGVVTLPNVTPGAAVTMTGRLDRLEGAGPCPAMVLLHG